MALFIRYSPSGISSGGGGGSGSGTVNSVALSDGSTVPIYAISGSPVTNTGTLTFTLNTQTANTFFAAPNGSSGQPGFRAIVAADIPTLNQNTTGTAANVTATSNSTLTTLSALSSAGTGVTANYFFAAPNGSSGALTPRAIVAADIPTLNQNTTGTAANVTATSNSTLTTLSALTTASSLSSVGTITTGTWSGTTVAVNKGGTGVTAVTTVPAATAWAGWDANKNLSANNLIDGYTTTVTAAATTTLTVGSTYEQYFTGTTTQTVTLPVVTTLVNGQAFQIVNLSTGAVTVQTSGANSLQVVASGYNAICTCINTAGGTGTASWSVVYANNSGTAASPLTTKGDVFTYSTTNARQAVPGDNGFLVPDSTQTTGWRSASYTTGLDARPIKNYIQYADFENNSTTGWTLGTVGTLTNGLPTGTPTFGSGAAGTLAIAATASSIAGAYSLSYADSNAAGTTAGNMVASSSYAIDAADQAKVLTVRFYYKLSVGAVTTNNFSGTNSNSFAWAAWDVTNSVWLSSAGNFNLVQNSGVGYCTGTIQTGATTANIRFVVYNANATTAATTMIFDDFYVGPQTAPSGPAMTDWVAYTPTFGAGFGTVSTAAGYSRRVGDSLQGRIIFQTGTVSSSAATVSLGYNGANANVSIDLTKVTVNDHVGTVAIGNSATTVFGAYVIAPSSNSTTLNFAVQTSTTNGTTAATGSNFTSTNYYTIDYFVPIVGWSSNSLQSSDTDTRTVAMRAYGAASSSLTSSYTALTGIPMVSDTHGAYTAATGQYVIPVTGYYNIAGQANLSGTASTGAGYYVDIYNVTSSSEIQANDLILPAALTGFVVVPIAANGVYLTAGTVIELRVQYTGTVSSPVATGSSSLFSVTRCSGPAVVAATESVNARYHAATGTVSSSNNLVTYSTKDFDSHNAYASGLYTAPVSGKYQVNAALLFAGTYSNGSTLNLSIYKNGSGYSVNQYVAYASSTTAVTVFLSDIVQCNAGDTISIYSLSTASSPSISSSNSANYLSIARVGN